MNPVEALEVSHSAAGSGRTGAEQADAEVVPVPEGLVKDLCRVFKLLADETRFKILLHLFRCGELNVTELCRRLEQSQPAVSHHLALLRVAGLIEVRRSGKHNYYSVQKKAFAELLGSLFASLGNGERMLRLEGIELELRCHDAP